MPGDGQGAEEEMVTRLGLCLTPNWHWSLYMDWHQIREARHGPLVAPDSGARPDDKE